MQARRRDSRLEIRSSHTTQAHFYISLLGQAHSSYKESTMSYSVSCESSSSSRSGFWSILSGSGGTTQQKKINELIRISTKAHRRSKKSHTPKLKKKSSLDAKSSLNAMAAKLTEFSKLTNVTSWSSLNMFAWETNKFNHQYEEDFGVEMDEDISLRTTYDFNRV